MGAIEKELYSRGNDRATAVILGSYVERSLQNRLMTVMRDHVDAENGKALSGEQGPLGTFSRKIIMAYALKLIGPICEGD